MPLVKVISKNSGNVHSDLSSQSCTILRPFPPPPPNSRPNTPLKPGMPKENQPLRSRSITISTNAREV